MTKKVPEGWQKTKLGEICKVLIGGTPSRANSSYWDVAKTTNNLWASIADLRNDVIIETKEYLTDLGVVKSNVKPVPAGTVMMSFKLTIGRVALAGAPLYTNEAIASFVDLRGIYRDYLKYILPQAANSVEHDEAVKGKTLNKEKLLILPILLPPLPEQEKIAEILGSVDEAIAATRQVIERTRSLKRSLTQTLLTKGIPGRHKKFKDSPLGKIPEDWEVCTIGDVLDRIEAGKSPNCEGRPAFENEWGVLKVSAVSWDQFRPHENKALPSTFEPVPALEVKAGDVLISRANTVALVGAVVRVRNTRPKLMLCDKTLRLVPNSKITPDFLLMSLRTQQARTWIENEATGTSISMKNISQETIRAIQLVLPKPEEQKLIEQAIASLNEASSKLTQKIERLLSVKQSLMSALLSGQIRVPVHHKQQRKGAA